MANYGYPNLYRDWGWNLGVYRAPIGWEHKWLAVGTDGTRGAHTRAEAREIRRREIWLEDLDK